MEEKVIRLNKSNVLRLAIETSEGEPTGNYLEFDLEDIELHLIYQDMLDEDKKNKELLKDRITIIERKKDGKGKKLMSENEEDKIKALN